MIHYLSIYTCIRKAVTLLVFGLRLSSSYFHTFSPNRSLTHSSSVIRPVDVPISLSESSVSKRTKDYTPTSSHSCSYLEASRVHNPVTSAGLVQSTTYHIVVKLIITRVHCWTQYITAARRLVSHTRVHTRVGVAAGGGGSHQIINGPRDCVI